MKPYFQDDAVTIWLDLVHVFGIFAAWKTKVSLEKVGHLSCPKVTSRQSQMLAGKRGIAIKDLLEQGSSATALSTNGLKRQRAGAIGCSQRKRRSRLFWITLPVRKDAGCASRGTTSPRVSRGFQKGLSAAWKRASSKAYLAENTFSTYFPSLESKRTASEKALCIEHGELLCSRGITTLAKIAAQGADAESKLNLRRITSSPTPRTQNCGSTLPTGGRYA